MLSIVRRLRSSSYNSINLNCLLHLFFSMLAQSIIHQVGAGSEILLSGLGDSRAPQRLP
jgi:hypothetical protein